MKCYTLLSLVLLIAILMTGGPVLGQSIKERIYVGEKACRQCHHLNGARNQFNKWRQTKHALAYAALSKPEAKEIAELSGIYVEPHASPICLGCHSTAYDVEAWERDDAFHFEDGVQCEFCHGAGSEYMDEDTMRDISKAMDAGLKKLKKSDCLVCHKEKRSHTAVLDVKGFIYEDALRQIAHSGLGGPLSGQEAEVPVSSDGAAYAGVIACAECHGESSKTHAIPRHGMRGPPVSPQERTLRMAFNAKAVMEQAWSTLYGSQIMAKRIPLLSP
jgi:hypothetical protein